MVVKFFVKADVECEHCQRRYEVELEAATECRGGYVVGGPSEYSHPEGWRFIKGGFYCPDHWKVERRYGSDYDTPTYSDDA